MACARCVRSAWHVCSGPHIPMTGPRERDSECLNSFGGVNELFTAHVRLIMLVSSFVRTRTCHIHVIALIRRLVSVFRRSNKGTNRRKRRLHRRGVNRLFTAHIPGRHRVKKMLKYHFYDSKDCPCALRHMTCAWEKIHHFRPYLHIQLYGIPTMLVLYTLVVLSVLGSVLLERPNFDYSSGGTISFRTQT